MEEADVLALVVRLPAANLQVELARPRVDLRLQVLDRLAAVGRLVTPPSRSRLTPLRTSIRTRVTLIGDQGRRVPHARPPPGARSPTSARPAARGARAAASRRPSSCPVREPPRPPRGRRAPASGSSSSGRQRAPARSPRAGELRASRARQPAVRQRVAGRRLERVPERVAEIELVARSVIVRVGEAHGCLERTHSDGRSPPSGSSQTGVAHQKPRLHHLRHAVPRARRSGGSRAFPGRSRPAPASGTQPTRFLPPGRSTAVLPPIAASTWPTRVVGTATHGTPRACTSPRRIRQDPWCSRRRARRSCRRGRS